MNIKFRQGSEVLSDTLIERAQIKIAKLSRLIVERNYEAQVYVDVEKDSNAHANSESLWRASINIDLAGDHFNASETGSTPEKATDLAIKQLKRELRTSKKKQESVTRRGAGLLKRLRQGFR